MKTQYLWLALPLILACQTVSAQTPPPYLPITQLLPPLLTSPASPSREQDCGVDGVACAQWVEDQLAEWESFFGCDHRAVFPTVYRMLTRQTRLQLMDDPSVFDDPAGLAFEAVKFYELYYDMITAHLAGDSIPPAWQTAMDAANSGNWTGAHDMLLAINAHVQRDMPFALAEVGLNLPDGSSRKADHDRFNDVLNAAYGDIVREVGRRYDPIMSVIDRIGGMPVNMGAMQLVALWREGVWRNAERLSASYNGPLWELTLTSIEQQADITAKLLRNGETPGRRALRDAYCASALAQEQEAAARVDTPDNTSDVKAGSLGWPLLGLMAALLWWRRR